MTRHPWPLPVVQEGYQIPLIRKPTPWKLRQIKLNQTEQSAVDKAVEKFLQAGIIEISPTQSKDYLSNFFTIQEAAIYSRTIQSVLFLVILFGKFHFGSTIAKNIHVLEAD